MMVVVFVLDKMDIKMSNIIGNIEIKIINQGTT